MADTPAAYPGGGVAPWVDWAQVRDWVDKTWDPENGPHHSIVGTTGSGKSYLAIEGILKPMCAMDRVLIVDTKRNDPLVSSIGKPTESLSKGLKHWKIRTRKPEPFDNWHRLVVHDQFRSEGRQRASYQVLEALEKVYNDGEWILFCDETQDLGGLRKPNLGLSMHLDEIYRKGRSRHVSIVATTQAPRHVPTSFYDQASYSWIGRLSDEDKQKRLREIGGLPKDMLPQIMALRKRQWLLTADSGEYFARTEVK